MVIKPSFRVYLRSSAANFIFFLLVFNRSVSAVNLSAGWYRGEMPVIPYFTRAPAGGFNCVCPVKVTDLLFSLSVNFDNSPRVFRENSCRIGLITIDGDGMWGKRNWFLFLQKPSPWAILFLRIASRQADMVINPHSVYVCLPRLPCRALFNSEGQRSVFTQGSFGRRYRDEIFRRKQAELTPPAQWNTKSIPSG